MWYTRKRIDISMADTWLKEEGQDFNRTYRLSSWWIGNRGKILRVFLLALAGLEGLIAIFVLWTLIDTFLINYTTENRSIGQMAILGQNDIYSQTSNASAKELSTGVARSLPASLGVDLYSEIVNPNSEWLAEYTYKFVWSGGSSAEEKGFILPGQTKPLVSFGVEEAVSARGIQVEISNIEWQRVNRHMVGEYEIWKQERLNFNIEDLLFATDVSIDGKIIGVSSFSVTNQTGFKYYQPSFFVVLYRGSQVVGINKVTLDALSPGERRGVDVRWFGTLPSADKSEIIPDINIFSPEAYQAL